jgi:thioredoxin-related protein
MKTRPICLIIVALALLASTVVLHADNCPVTSLEDAKMKSVKTGLPILIKIGTEWCKDCKTFDEVVKTDEEIHEAVAKNVILYTVKATEGEGKEIAKDYSVHNFPHFILTDNNGETIDRWYGFACQDCFTKRLTASIEDRVTVSKRVKRFQKSPSEEDALKLGNIRHSEGMFAEATAYYSRAKSSDPETNYETMIFNSMAYGNYYNLYSPVQVRQQADAVLASANYSDKDLMKVAFSMYKVSRRANDISLFTPYLKVSIEETVDSKDEDIVHKRAKLMPDYTLHIKKDSKKAVKLKKESLPEGWQKEANELNNFAWWCFENNINLKEAEKSARKGIELASPGNEKANILDTLAEICNLSGDCGDAVEYIRLAVAEDPENEYFQDQLIRFEKLLASQP